MPRTSTESREETRLLSGWGLKFFDYDNDGLMDLILANGHPDDSIESNYARVKYKEPLLLYHQEQGLLHNVTADAGPVFSKPLAARGLAVGDYDNDGFLDVLVGTNGGAPVLLHNRCGSGNHWLGVRLVGTNCNRDAIGARLTWSAGGVNTNEAEKQRRKLSFVARSAGGAGIRRGREDRLAGNQVAVAQREGAEVYGSAD